MTKYIIAIVFTILLSATKVTSQINPDDVGGLELWLRSTDNLTLSEEKVVSWGDLSINGLTLNQNTVVSRGILISSVDELNGFPAVKLDGINDFYSLSSSLDDVRTVFLIAKHQTGTSTEPEPILGHSTFYDFHGDNGSKLFRSPSVSSGLKNGICRVNQVTIPAIQIDKPLDYSILSFVSNSELHFNQLGRDRTQNRFWNGEYVEIIMYSDSLSSEEVEGIESYLRERYAPPVDLGPDIFKTDFCEFDLSISGRFKSVMWNTGSTDFDITVSESGVYWVEAVDVFGGISRDSIEVNFPVNIIEDFALCAGSDSIWNPDISDSSIEWQDGSTNNEFVIIEGGEYSFVASDGTGCTYNSPVVVVSEDSFPNAIEIGSPNPFCIGNTLALEGLINDIVSVEWSTGFMGLEITPDSDGQYSVITTNHNGCLAQDTVLIASAGVAPNVSFTSVLNCDSFGADFEDTSSTTDGSDIELWTWAIDGNEFGSNSNISSIADQVGEHTISLVVQTSSGCTGTYLETIDFPDQPSISISENTYCAGSQYSFELVVDFPFDDVLSQSWEIYDLDGSIHSSSNTSTISTEFNMPGDYLVEAEIIGASGCVRVANTYLNIKDESFCFNPALNPDLVLWLAADQNIVQTDGVVASWSDQRNNGVSAISPSSDKSPVFITSVPKLNNQPALRFDGVNDFMDFGEITDIRNIFVVYKHHSGYQALPVPIFGHPTYYDFHGNTVDNLLFSPTSSSASLRSGEARFNGNPTLPIELLKPEEYGILSLNPIDTLRAQYITNDRNSTGRVWKGDYVEILFYNDSLSSEEIYEVEQYLRYKYAPPVDLPREIRIDYGFCAIDIDGYKPWFTSYEWSTGSTDSLISTQKSGTYSLTVTDIFGYESTDSVKVIFNGVFRESDNILCDGDIFTYDTGLNTNDYAIEWNTLETSSAITITTEGDVFVNVLDTLGCVFNSDTIFVDVDTFPTIMELIDHPVFCLGNELYLSSGFAEAESYAWSTGATTPFISPFTSGEYWVEATNANGCIGRDTVQVDIAGAAPYVQFTNGVACKGNEVVFTDLTDAAGSEIVDQSWVFPGSTAEGSSVGTAFPETGSYPIQLTVLLANGCSGTGRDTVEVSPLPLVGFNYDSVIPCAGNEVAYESQSGVPGTGTIAEYSWQFGNGTTATGVVGTTTFADMGVETVQLTVTTGEGCVDSLLAQVVVLGSPVADFSFDTVCVGTATVFNEAVDVSESGAVFYQWQFGDGYFSNFPNTSHVYAAAGVYDVRLTATGNDFGGAGCVDTVTKQVRVYNAPAGAVTTTDGCLGEAVVFTDMTVPAVQGGVADYVETREWVLPFGYGQGPVTVGGDSVQVWNADEAGGYAVQLNFVTASGCAGTASANVEVLAVPEASFVLEMPEVSPPFTVTPQNTSTDAQSYKWFINDVEVSTLAEPELLFSDTGFYDVGLVGMNTAGCNDTLVQSFHIIYPDYDLAILDIRYTLSGNRLALRALLANNGNTTLAGFDMQVSLGLSSAMDQFMDFALLPGDVVEFTLPQMFEYFPSRDLPYVCISVGLRSFGIVEANLENNDFCIGLDKTRATFINPYPNPVTGVVKLGFVLPFSGDVGVRVTDSSGREMGRFVYGLEGGYSLMEYDVSGFSEGVYFFRYEFGGEEVVKRVVVVAE